MSAGFESRFGWAFQEPAWLLLLLLVPVALAWRWRRGAATLPLAALAVVDPPDGPLPVSARLRFAWLPTALTVAGLVLLVAALARPAARVPAAEERAGLDIMLCLDASSSMGARDLASGDDAPTRLAVARDAADRFVAARADDRIGLVLFARYPDLRCPPTTDHDALRAILATARTVTSDGGEDATGIGTAVARAAQALSTGDAASRLVILLTDGDENVATAGKADEIAPVHAGQLCTTLGVRVYTVAVGPRPASGTEDDGSGVRALATATGGAWFRAESAAAVDAVYDAIADLERAPRAAPRFELRERFLAFALAAALLLGLAPLLAGTVWRRLP